eukprot:1154299-Pelagomonas_calceolata.AAC.7
MPAYYVPANQVSSACMANKDCWLAGAPKLVLALLLFLNVLGCFCTLLRKHYLELLSLCFLPLLPLLFSDGWEGLEGVCLSLHQSQPHALSATAAYLVVAHPEMTEEEKQEAKAAAYKSHIRKGFSNFQKTGSDEDSDFD